MKNIVEYIQEHVFEHPQMMSNIYENYNVVKMYFEDKDIPDFCNELLTQNYSNFNKLISFIIPDKNE